MRQPSEEQRAQFDAMGAEPLEIPEAGEGFTVYVRPFEYAEFRTFINEASKGGAEGLNARIAAMHRACVWPSRAEMNKAYEVFAGTLGRVIDAIERFSGKHEETWIRFDASVTPEQLVELGIPQETADTLRADNPYPGQLWICHIEPLDEVLVVRRPNSSVAIRMFERCAAAFFDGALEAATDCVVWPEPERVAALFRELPAIPPNIIVPKLRATIRGEARAEKKGFMPKGRKSAR